MTSRLSHPPPPLIGCRQPSTAESIFVGFSRAASRSGRTDFSEERRTKMDISWCRRGSEE
ncbi:hypothetical protein JMJ77_0013904, partial [Colletotrichum scovillei]